MSRNWSTDRTDKHTFEVNDQYVTYYSKHDPEIYSCEEVADQFADGYDFNRDSEDPLPDRSDTVLILSVTNLKTEETRIFSYDQSWFEDFDQS